jgi:hypothetical protein
MRFPEGFALIAKGSVTGKSTDRTTRYQHPKSRTWHAERDWTQPNPTVLVITSSTDKKLCVSRQFVPDKCASRQYLIS